ncbi:hypothetical protein GCM10009552_17410 [Rothia nasimurium]
MNHAIGAVIASLGRSNASAAGIGAAANQAAIPIIVGYLTEHRYKADSPEFATMMQVVSASIRAAVGGG